MLSHASGVCDGTKKQGRRRRKKEVRTEVRQKEFSHKYLNYVAFFLVITWFCLALQVQAGHVMQAVYWAVNLLQTLSR